MQAPIKNITVRTESSLPMTANVVKRNNTANEEYVPFDSKAMQPRLNEASSEFVEENINMLAEGKDEQESELGLAHLLNHSEEYFAQFLDKQPSENEGAVDQPGELYSGDGLLVNANGNNNGQPQLRVGSTLTQAIAMQQASKVNEEHVARQQVMSEKPQLLVALPKEKDGNDLMLKQNHLAMMSDQLQCKKIEGDILSFERLSSLTHVATQPMVNPERFSASMTAAESASRHAVAQYQASVDITKPEWGRELVDQLRSRMQFSKSEHLKQAHVRLDPPELGKLDINLRMDGDKVSVHFTAAHPQLREALIANAERLRMDFDNGQLQLGHVSVSSGQQDHRQGQSGSGFGQEPDPSLDIKTNNQHKKTKGIHNTALGFGHYESMV